jgi:hypothetical protein
MSGYGSLQKDSKFIYYGDFDQNLRHGSGVFMSGDELYYTTFDHGVVSDTVYKLNDNSEVTE